jgi:hypothetical protein
MFCRSVILRSLNSIAETIQVTGGHILASPAQNHPDRLWGPPTLLVNRCKGVKRPRFDADQLFLTSFEIKNKCSCTSTHHCLHGIRTEFIKVSNRRAASILKAKDAVIRHIYIYVFPRNQLSPSTGQKPTNQNVTPQKTTLHIDRLKNVR